MEILRYAAFSADPSGGNPAGVVLDATGATDAEMQAVAAEVGYAETAFLTPHGGREFDIRYFSPLAEVPFCGHATVATAVAYAQRHGAGTLRFTAPVGLVEVATSLDGPSPTATLTTVPPRMADLDPSDLKTLLALLGWDGEDLDPRFPPQVGFAGAWHPLLVTRSRERLAKLEYDYDGLATLMAARTWLTIDMLWQESPSVYWARNAFPPGGYVEDPASGASAAAFGGYLRAHGMIEPPTRLTIHQGDDMGRPGILIVDVSADAESGIAVSGTAVPID
jgi:PhzF family phenazine biosynthesis protein